MPDDPREFGELAIAAQLADLRHKVLELSARVTGAGTVSVLGQVRQKLIDLTGQVATLAEDVSGLAGQVTVITAEERVVSPSAPTWLDLTAGEHAQQLAALAEWVAGVLTPNYLHKPLRPCWPDHMPAVWELSTLCAEWARIYTRQRPDLPGALTWQDRWLPGARNRLDLILLDCKGSCVLAKSQAPAQVRPRAV